MSKKIIPYNFIIFLLVLFIFVFLIISFFNLNFIKKGNFHILCGDGTFYNKCSQNKPYFCEDYLIEKASFCGCSEGFEVSNENCISKLYMHSTFKNLNYTLRFKNNKINFLLYDDVYSYLLKIPREINSSLDKNITRLNFKLMKINNEIQRQAILPLIIQIENLHPNSKEDQARVAISLVQNIPYKNIKEPIFNETIASDYPYQVLFNNKGTCEEKSELLVLILKELGYKIAIFYYPYENHEAVGIGCPIKYSLNNSGYCFIEITAPSLITDNKGYYLDGSSLKSVPMIIPISDGISFSFDMYEYSDAKSLINIRDKHKLNLFYKSLNFYIKKKYGLY